MMKTETRTIYIANDGTVFPDKAPCEAHEKQIAETEKMTSYWHIFHSPDLTEGRGYFGSLYVKLICHDSHLAENFLMDYCFRSWESPIAYVMGASPTMNWGFSKCTRDQYAEARGTSVGDTKVAAKRITLIQGAKNLVAEQ